MFLKLKLQLRTIGLMQSTTTTQNNLFEHKTHTQFLAFKLLMLIIAKQLFSI